MTAVRREISDQVNAAIAADASDGRELSLEEHAELLRLACQAAARLEEARARAGLAPAAPVPWPESTSAFLKRHAQAVRESS